MKIEDLGLSKDELRELVVDRICEQLLYASGQICNPEC